MSRSTTAVTLTWGGGGAPAFDARSQPVGIEPMAARSRAPHPHTSGFGRFSPFSFSAWISREPLLHRYVGERNPVYTYQTFPFPSIGLGRERTVKSRRLDKILAPLLVLGLLASTAPPLPAQT